MSEILKLLKSKNTYTLVTIIILICGFSAQSQEIKVDHVITVVKDLDKTVEDYTQKGFTIKKGKLHKNGLINGHIKFKNKTSCELMSIQGEPTDAIAKNYKTLLDTAEGGVFLAISGISSELMESRLSSLKIEYTTTKGKYWDYITFPETSDLAHFFFIEYHIPINTSENFLNHKNNSRKISEVYLEGDKNVTTFLKGIGLKSSKKMNDTDVTMEERYFTETGDIIVIPKKDSSQRPRIKAVSFAKEDGTESFRLSL